MSLASLSSLLQCYPLLMKLTLICAGKVSAVAYDSFDDLLADIDAEIAKEDSRE